MANPEVVVYDDDLKDRKSSNIRKARYRPMEEVLTVEFKNGGIYEYRGVPSHVVYDFALNDSVGSYFYHHIRSNYQFEQVE